MRNSSKKLGLNRETLRALSGRALVLAAGGMEATITDGRYCVSDPTNCVTICVTCPITPKASAALPTHCTCNAK